MKPRRTNKQKITPMVSSMKHVPTKHLDKKIMDRIWAAIFEQLKSHEIYQDNAGVVDHYQQLLYAVESLYTYIYTKRHSHLTKEDAKIFASYISDRVRKLKDIVEQTH